MAGNRSGPCACAGGGGVWPIGWLLPCAVAVTWPMAGRPLGGNRRSNRFPLIENSCWARPWNPAASTGIPTTGTETAAAAGSAPKIRFLRVLQHNTRTGVRAHALSTRYIHVKLLNTYGVPGVAYVPTVCFNVHSSLFCVICSCKLTIVCV